jgi:hypothetical protein
MPPMAIAAPAPTAGVSVATAVMTKDKTGCQDELVYERAAGADAGDGGAQLGGLIGPDGEQQQRRHGGAGQLRGDIRGGPAGREVACGGEGDRDGRVDGRLRGGLWRKPWP